MNFKKTVRITIVLLFVIASTAAFARNWNMETENLKFGNLYPLFGPYAKAELSAIKIEIGDKPFGELSIAQLNPYWERMSVAMSKDLYLEKTARMSFWMPGAGQFRNGDSAEGFGFMTLNLTVVAGTIASFYFLLPSDLRFDKLDYLNKPIKEINDAWNSHSINDYLPSVGAMLLGTIIDFGIRFWSSSSAYSGAKEAIDSGKAKLEPIIGPGYLGMGMRF